ncbi:sugar ABC transporter substrate-binding protein [Agrobacterium tumefaciens]|uniref:Simple sugar transport system substrate-binding protein n=1 Tax=Agrobacterium tumefaciens TaxID=358 RepID=A0A2L2LJ54_AGRTU|nr:MULTISPECIES: sugar ABC transporter substrate-binding protein [Agrobacterium]MCZ7502917.1 sugar ABC transporter substrate-binding protein [Rhizobium rhizogenes]AVH44372.1 simple sugar transport system substrate-binding protein [Agrobacterium tumefaciens]NSY95111.1 sugar ABC transporter substrate-binding protein [Agrobacterium tumefaciens]NSZ03837.1 sugar ABC transporter substrate-binding protein [Agrobacterium tumefaciens]NSZ38618.1 sugar ABC transporter substrate-binding protein [Agrobacte
MKSIWKNVASAALAVSLAAAGSVGVKADEQPSIIVVTHGQASDPFWSIVKNGMMQAGKDINAKVDYRAPETFDMVAMAQLIEAAVNQNPAGIVISNPDPDALGPAIAKAVAAGIPVISMNSGIAATEKLGIRLHVGQDELTAGVKVGEKLKSLGKTHVLCVNQEVGNAALDQRCAGTEKGFEGGKVTILPTTADPAEIESKIQAALTSDPSVDVVLGLSAPLVGERAVAVVEKMGHGDKVKVASFDLSANFLKAVSEGKALFAVDQQPYLQGYLPVTFLALNAKYGTIPAGNVASGPSFVEKDAAASVIEKSSQGIR